MTAGGRPRRRRVVLVCGPPLAGVTAVADALRDGLAGIPALAADLVVESVDLRPGDVAAAVVFVVSAAARLAASDCAMLDDLLDATAAPSGRVIGVVSKIDVHRGWRGAVDASRDRYPALVWVGVAAAPALGEPRVGRLVELLGACLSEEQNVLPNNSIRVTTEAPRKSGAERAVLLRGRTQQARVQLGALARRRCAAVRAELTAAAGALTRRDRRAFPDRVRARLEHAAAEVDDAVTDHLAVVAAELGLPDEVAPPAIDLPLPPDPAALTGGLESRLTMLLGTGFGLGVALTLGRTVAELAPGYAMGAAISGLCAGAALTAWVVAARRLLAERIAMQRWVAEAVDALRGAADEAVALRIVTVERLWSGAMPGSAAGDRRSESMYPRT